MTSESESHALAVAPAEGRDFIRTLIDRDLATGKHTAVVTRFPPEPNGYMHIGHSKSVCLNFGLAQEFGGRCHLRFDDTNPTTEDMEYVEAIQRDVRWLGFDWGEHLYFASDYYERLYQFAEELIAKGLAYVDSLNELEMREHRGTITEPGRPSPYRERSVQENLDLFRRMRAGEFPDGAHVLRAKIDLANPNMKMRDPPIYRIRHAHHYRTGDTWCIYPLYDFTHCLSDALEHITHSLCTLEFENNRELYDWFIERLEVPSRPEQTEFARLAVTYTVTSKRKLLALVKQGRVSGWDDPRMPTIAGLRRRGYTAEALRAFAERVGLAKHNSLVEFELLEHTLRDDLNRRAPRLMCVLRPLKIVIENYPADHEEWLDADLFPADVGRPGTRKLPFCRELYVDREDFALAPPRGWHRLAPGAEVRLRYACVVRCERVVQDERGEVVELICSYDPSTRGGKPADGRRVKGTIHWVSARHALRCEVRLYDRLFKDPQPDAAELLEALNPESLSVLQDALVEPAIGDPAARSQFAAAFGVRDLDLYPRFQFERVGFFCEDRVDSTPERPVFNRTVSLKDSWAKREARPLADKPATQAASELPRPARPRPQAPLAARARAWVDEHGIAADQARVLDAEARLVALFEAGLALGAKPKALAGWLTTEVQRVLEETAELRFGAPELVELLLLVEDGTLSQRAAKDVFSRLAAEGGAPSSLVESMGLRQIDDRSALEPVVERVLAANPDPVARYRAGNAKLLGAFVGQVMKATGGKASPRLVNELLLEKLGPISG